LEVLNDNLVQSLPHGVIHTDIFPDNVMFFSENEVAIIDWEEVSYDALIIDVSVIIVAFCFKKIEGSDLPILDLDLIKAFLEHYVKERPFVKNSSEIPVELEALPSFVQSSALGVACWRFRQYNMNHNVPTRHNIHLDMYNRIEASRALKGELRNLTQL